MRHHLGDEMISTSVVYDKNVEAFNLTPLLILSMKPGYHLSPPSPALNGNIPTENSQVDQRAALFGSRFPGAAWPC